MTELNNFKQRFDSLWGICVSTRILNHFSFIAKYGDETVFDKSYSSNASVFINSISWLRKFVWDDANHKLMSMDERGFLNFGKKLVYKHFLDSFPFSLWRKTNQFVQWFSLANNVPSLWYVLYYKLSRFLHSLIWRVKYVNLPKNFDQKLNWT